MLTGLRSYPCPFPVHRLQPKSFSIFSVYHLPWEPWLYKTWVQLNFHPSISYLPTLILHYSQDASCTLTPLHPCSCWPPLLAPHPIFLLSSLSLCYWNCPQVRRACPCLKSHPVVGILQSAFTVYTASHCKNTLGSPPQLLRMCLEHEDDCLSSVTPTRRSPVSHVTGDE